MIGLVMESDDQFAEGFNNLTLGSYTESKGAINGAQQEASECID
jgi:hypothetical protein